MPGYFVGLNLIGRDALVIGGGKIAAFKVDGLLACGARVRVVSPEFVPELAARDDISCIARPYAPELLGDPIAVFACTDDTELNRRIADDAKARGLLCNAVDDPEYCDFFVPAMLHRGDLTVAVGTAGASPSLAATVRDRLASQITPELAILVDAVRRMRRRIQEQWPTGARRLELLSRLGSDESLELFERQGLDAWQRWADRLSVESADGKEDNSRTREDELA